MSKPQKHLIIFVWTLIIAALLIISFTLVNMFSQPKEPKIKHENIDEKEQKELIQQQRAKFMPYFDLYSTILFEPNIVINFDNHIQYWFYWASFSEMCKQFIQTDREDLIKNVQRIMDDENLPDKMHTFITAVSVARYPTSLISDESKDFVSELDTKIAEISKDSIIPLMYNIAVHDIVWDRTEEKSEPISFLELCHQWSASQIVGKDINSFDYFEKKYNLKKLKGPSLKIFNSWVKYMEEHIDGLNLAQLMILYGMKYGDLIHHPLYDISKFKNTFPTSDTFKLHADIYKQHLTATNDTFVFMCVMLILSRIKKNDPTFLTIQKGIEYSQYPTRILILTTKTGLLLQSQKQTINQIEETLQKIGASELIVVFYNIGMEYLDFYNICLNLDPKADLTKINSIDDVDDLKALDKNKQDIFQQWLLFMQHRYNKNLGTLMFEYGQTYPNEV